MGAKFIRVPCPSLGAASLFQILLASRKATASLNRTPPLLGSGLVWLSCCWLTEQMVWDRASVPF